jgi:hypothetical protein
LRYISRILLNNKITEKDGIIVREFRKCTLAELKIAEVPAETNYQIMYKEALLAPELPNPGA